MSADGGDPTMWALSQWMDSMRRSGIVGARVKEIQLDFPSYSDSLVKTGRMNFSRPLKRNESNGPVSRQSFSKPASAPAGAHANGAMGEQSALERMRMERMRMQQSAMEEHEVVERQMRSQIDELQAEFDGAMSMIGTLKHEKESSHRETKESIRELQSHVGKKSEEVDAFKSAAAGEKVRSERNLQLVQAALSSSRSEAYAWTEQAQESQESVALRILQMESGLQSLCSTLEENGAEGMQQATMLRKDIGCLRGAMTTLQTKFASDSGATHAAGGA